MASPKASSQEHQNSIEPNKSNANHDTIGRPRHAASADSETKSAAATVIQKNYRGYRARRQIRGISMNPSDRWDDALKEATYRHRTRPTPRSSLPTEGRSHAKAKWKLASEVTRRARNEDLSETSGEEGMNPEELDLYRKKKAEARADMEKHARMMGLEYWLEMVDHKHRYGSNLRAYHAEWKKAPTHENFFYWLDEGEGKDLDLPTRSRQRLDSEQVRYLSREERQHYLVRVDSDGRLCWAKNGQRISTTAEYRDSVEGIVPKTSPAPTWASRENDKSNEARSGSTPSSTSSSSTGPQIDAEQRVNTDLDHSKASRKFSKASPATILNQLVQKPAKPGAWIWVADTSFRLYLGIKNSGSFQHSSFLHGSRLAAAGQIKIKDGRIGRISPLSGHYRPPTRNFKLFVQSLRDAGADMSHVSISRSYAVVVGLEAYLNTTSKFKRGITLANQKKESVLNPEAARKRQEAETDQSESAKREREHLLQEQKLAEEMRSKMTLKEKMLHKLHLDNTSHPSPTSPNSSNG